MSDNKIDFTKLKLDGDIFSRGIDWSSNEGKPNNDTKKVKVQLVKLKEDFEIINCTERGKASASFGIAAGYFPCIKQEKITIKKGTVLQAHSYSNSDYSIKYKNGQFQIPTDKLELVGTKEISVNDWGSFKNDVQISQIIEDSANSMKLAKLQLEIAKLPNGAAERDKLIAELNSQAELNRASERNLKIYIGLGIVAVLSIGYFAYKKFKK